MLFILFYMHGKRLSYLGFLTWLLWCDRFWGFFSSFFIVNYLLPNFAWCVMQKACLSDKASGIRVQKQPGIQVEPCPQFSGIFVWIRLLSFPSESFPGIRWYHPSCDISWRCPALTLSAPSTHRWVTFIPVILRIATLREKFQRTSQQRGV